MSNRAQRRRLIRLGEKGIGMVTGEGPPVQAISKFRNPDFPEQRPGVHLWTTMHLYRCAEPEADQFFADMENLITIEGPGCYWCEEPYTRDLAGKPCKGESR